MNVGVFLAIGESFHDFRSKGQDELIKNYLLKNYSRHFNQVFVFSYGNERFSLWGNVHILPNRYKLHRYLYALLLPLFYLSEIRSCGVFRGLQISGGLTAAIAKLVSRKPFVVNYGYDYVNFALAEGKPWQSFLYKLVTHPILFSADKIIVTAYYLSIKQPKWASEKVIILPNGVDSNVFKPRKKQKIATKRVIYFGRFEPQKNLLNLIEAISLIKEKTVELILIGKGSLEKKMRSLITQLSVNAYIHSPLSHSKLPQVLQEADIFVLPSVVEGQPKALLEAMSCGLPVIVSDIEAHREIIENGKNGFLSGTDINSLSMQIGGLLKDVPLQKKLGRAARRTVLASYSMSKLNREEIDLLRKVIKP